MCISDSFCISSLYSVLSIFSDIYIFTLLYYAVEVKRTLAPTDTRSLSTFRLCNPQNISYQLSISASLACAYMKSLLGPTSDPISISVTSEASLASSISTLFKTRLSGSRVVEMCIRDRSSTHLLCPF